MASPPGTPRLSHKRASSNGNGNTPNTGARRTRRNNNNLVLTPFDSLKSIDISPKCTWWGDFSIKITNLVNLLNRVIPSKEADYVIAGSCANALLTYFYRPDLLCQLDAPK